jgi:hypothetical protein
MPRFGTAAGLQPNGREAFAERRLSDRPVLAMVVHSFSAEQAGFSDFAVFAELLGASPQIDAIARARDLASVELWLGWVAGEPRFLEA